MPARTIPFSIRNQSDLGRLTPPKSSVRGKDISPSYFYPAELRFRILFQASLQGKQPINFMGLHRKVFICAASHSAAAKSRKRLLTVAADFIVKKSAPMLRSVGADYVGILLNASDKSLFSSVRHTSKKKPYFMFTTFLGLPLTKASMFPLKISRSLALVS